MRKNIIFSIIGLSLITALVFRYKPQIPTEQPVGGSVVEKTADVAKVAPKPGLQLYPSVPEELNEMDFQCNFSVRTMGVIFNNLGTLVVNIPLPMEIVSYKFYGLRNNQSYTFMCVDAEQYIKTDIETTELSKARSAVYFLEEKSITLNFQPITLNNTVVTSAVAYQTEKTKVLNEIIKLQTTSVQITAINDLAKIASKEVCRFVFVPSSDNLLKDYLISVAQAMKNNQCL